MKAKRPGDERGWTTRAISAEVRPLLAFSVVAAAAAMLTGCPNPNTYGTPRTTPPGKISHSVAAEAWGFKATDGATDAEVSAVVPVPPTYTLRVGLADPVDIGVRVANMTSLGADVKWNFIKGDVFDMALDPGFQWYSISVGEVSTNVIYLNGPLLLGFNLDDSISLVLTPGVTYGLVSADITSDGNEAGATSDGMLGRLGLGFDFRISDGFAIHPEITFLKTLSNPDNDDVLMYTFGVGFNFGKLPHFGAEAPAPAGG
jgi:hypothetical protein